MEKLYRSGLLAALTAILLPVLLLTALGAMRDAAQTPEPSQTVPVEETVEEAAEPEPASDTPSDTPALAADRWDATQTVPLMTPTGLQQLTMADYLLGVLLGELPASFEPEAIAAQAVAARTFTLRQLQQGKHDGWLCSEASCCQAWLDPAGQDPAWLAQLRQAIDRTDGQVLTYEGELIEALFFSCSGGRTEAAVEVWGGDVPYLTSVESPGEEDAPRYCQTVSWAAGDFRQAILAAYPQALLSGTPEEWIGAVSYTQGGGVDEAVIGGQAIPGTALRQLLGLNSTQFEIQLQGDTLLFVTWGFGHRVGMSQYGANAMAREGADYTEILTHYYVGTALTTAY